MPPSSSSPAFEISYMDFFKVKPAKPSRPTPSIIRLEGSGTDVDSVHTPGELSIWRYPTLGLNEPSITLQPMQPGGFVLENISSPGVSHSIFQPMIWLREFVTTL